MKRASSILKVVWLLAGWLVCQPAPGQVAISSNRFLFIVETSRAMKKQLPAAVLSVQELVTSGLNGQLQPGDTLGIWTFDSELHTGVFPMQIWTGSNRSYVADATAGFLSQQKPQGRARLAAVLPAMLRLIEESEVLTVLLYSEGSQPINGTPFDDFINETYKLHQGELVDARLPFATVLVGRAGKLVKCTVNSAVGVNVPEIPLSEKTAAAPPTETNAVTTITAPATNQSPAKVAAPLVVNYSKSDSSIVVTNRGGPDHEKMEGAGDGTMGSDHAPSHVLAAASPTVPPESVPPTATRALTLETSLAAAASAPAAAPVSSAPTTEPQPAAQPSAPAVVSGAKQEYVVTSVTGPIDVNRRRGIWFILGVVGGFLVFPLVWLLWARLKTSRKGPGSLITKSLDREKKS